MTATSSDARCLWCDAPLPADSRRGRPREYCGATCRSAARRARYRATNADRHVIVELTGSSIGNTLDRMIAELDDDARTVVLPTVSSMVQMIGALAAGPAGSLDAVAAGGGLADGTDALQRTAVGRARADRRTWAEIGSALGISRQAAFQRFARTGAELSEPDRTAALTRAGEVLTALAAGDFEGVHEAFDAQMAAGLDVSGLAGMWANITGTVGQYERMGTALPRRVGEHVVVDVPLAFEGGDLVGRITLDAAQRVAGLFLLHPEAVQ